MTHNFDLDKIDRIVILNMIPNTIGDSLFLKPMFKIIKKNYPSKYLAVTASKISAELLKDDPYLDEIIEIPELSDIGRELPKTKKMFIYFKMIFNTSKVLKNKKFDLIIVNQPNFPLLQLIPTFSGIKHSIGFHYPRSIFSFMLSKKIKFCDGVNYPNRHFLESNLDLIKPLSIKYSEDDKLIIKDLNKEEIIKAKKFLSEKSIKGKFICMQAGAKWKSKQWPKESFRALAKNLAERGFKIILLGSQQEYELNEFIKNNNKDIINLSGKINLNEVAAVLRLAKLLVGNDSGLTHLAASVGTKTLTIYGTTSYEHSKPLGNNISVAIFQDSMPSNKLIIGDKTSDYHPKMSEIKNETVLEGVKILLKK